MEIVPAIDIIEGKCVRLAQGDFARAKVYSDDPSETARQFEAAGLRRLHMVDLDGAKTGKVTNLKTLELIAEATNLTIDFGGGIKSSEDLKSVFDAGASMAGIGTLAVNDPAKFFEWVEQYGPESFLVGADVRDGKLAINGWQTNTEIEIATFLEGLLARKIDQVFVTDIAKDGLLQGPATALYTQILHRLPALKLIASGGVRSISDIDELEAVGCSGAIVGKAIYEGRISLNELSRYVS